MVPFEFGPSDSYVLLFDGTTMKVMRNGGMVESSPGVNYSVACTCDKDSLRWVQSGDTLFITDGVRPPKKIVRGASAPRDTNWTVSDSPMTPEVFTSTVLTVTGAGPSTTTIRYRVTATDINGEETSVFRGPVVIGTSALGTPWVITSSSHGLQTNDTIEVSEGVTVGGTVVYKAGDLVRIVVTGPGTFTVPGPSPASPYAGDFKYRKTMATATAIAPAPSTPCTVSWSAKTGATYYNVFREYGRVFGYIGSTSDTSFVDYGIIPDLKDTPVVGVDPGKGGTYPSSVGLFQQRLMFGGFTDDVERIVASHVGNYSAFDPGAEDTSGIDFGLAGRTVSAVQHVLEIAGRAVVLTNTSEWTLKGGPSGGLTPTAINARADSYHGCSPISPALVGSSLIYVHRGEKILLDAMYDYSQEALKSRDLTLWAKHLLVPGISRVCYQRSENLIWVLRKDGVLLGLTYVPDQEVWGWHQHEIANRAIEDICVVSESNVDRLYCLTRKGTGYRICRLPSEWDWESDSVDDWRGFDEAIEYDGRNLLGVATMTLSGGTDWKTTDSLTITASSAVFSGGDVGKVLELSLAGSKVQVTITASTSTTQMTVQPRSIVPESMRNVACSYAVCATTFTGANHLEGETVGVIADGGREANRVVSGGTIAYSRPFARVHIGLPIVSDAKTLPLEVVGKETMLGNKRHITRVVLNVYRSRGIKVGLDESTLETMINEYDDLLNSPPAVQTGPREVIMVSAHSDTGEILIRQDTGMPAHILEVRPIFNVGESR